MKKMAIAIVALLILAPLISYTRGAGNKISWTEYREGMKEANETGKPVLLYFYSNETSDVFLNKTIVMESNNYVMIKINSSNNESHDLLTQYNITKVPSIIIIKDGKEFAKINSLDKDLIIYTMDEANPGKNKILWFDYHTGMKVSNESGKPILLYFYYPYHKLCQETDDKIFNNSAVIDKSRNFVMIKVNVGDNNNTNILYKYRFQYIYYTYNNNVYPYLPMVIFLNKSKEILHRLITYDVYNAEDANSVQNFLTSMDKALKGEIWGYDFAFVTLDGKTKHLKDYRGKVVLVDLMATWCQPCRMQMAQLKKVLQHFGKNNIEIISIDVEEKDTPEKIRNTFGDHINEWTFGMDEYKVSYRFWASSIPTLIIFDEYGRLQLLRPGLTQSDDLIKILSDIGLKKSSEEHNSTPSFNFLMLLAAFGAIAIMMKLQRIH
ncbi:MAG: redoxin domain-containing protein [Thermoplasmata archaeon]|nr:redoxin domain-containing protein [Thermoplasmata archaeon]